MKRTAIITAALFLLITAGCAKKTQNEKIPVRVLILPKFEVGEMSGDFPGEAQYFYEEYLIDADSYAIEGSPNHEKLYYKDGIAMFLCGQGKISAALSTAAVLSDQRFDFSGANILSVGCGGSAEGNSIFGDVCVISAAVDYDLGHHADPREMSGDSETTWFHDESFDDSSAVSLDETLTESVYELIKDIQPQTTESTVNYLKKQYPDEAWAQRQPAVIRGTAVTSDNFWKGKYNHSNAVKITETYHCKDPYAITEMEDIAVCRAVQSHGLLDRLIILRVSVNMDTFPEGVTPEMLWGEETEDHIASDDSMESVDIFATAMENCFEAGKKVIDTILEGKLQ